MPTTEAASGTSLLLDWWHRPYDPEAVVAALLGLTARSARQVVGTALATSDEAEALLAAMPAIVRSLAIATTDRPERCLGELRGPVLWAETMSARSSSAGDPGLFVCATTTKAYDTDENRVLKAALHAVQRAGRTVEQAAASRDEARQARHNSQHAARLLEHQTLAQVPVTRPNGRSLRRTRAGSRRHTYAPALAVLRRAERPVTAAHLRSLADPRTRAQHDLLAATIEAVATRAGQRPVVRTRRGAVIAGPVTYEHPRRPGAEVPGIALGATVLLDVSEDSPDGPSLSARAGGRVPIVVADRADLERALGVAGV